MSNVALQLTELSKTYSNGFTALKGVSLSVERGDFFAILGPNGAGKSTMISIITSLLTKSGGQVEVAGHDLAKEPVLAKMSVGLVPQEFNFNPFEKVINILINQAMFYGIPLKEAKKRAKERLEQMELWDKRDNRARYLSGGMKRRMMIARALMHNPKILILDEPTAGVDIEIRKSMWRYLQALNEEGVTIILTTHYLEEAESLCNKIAIIDHGEIIIESSMQGLLRTLDSETMVVETNAAITQNLPARMVKVDDVTIEVDMTKSESIQSLVDELKAIGIEVHRVRNKANRLEQLFMKLLEERDQEEVAS